MRAEAEARLITAEGLEKRYGRKRVLRGVSFVVPRGGFLRRHRPQRLRQDDPPAASSRGSRPPTRGTLERRRRPCRPRLSRARAARLSRAHRRREPRPLRQALPGAGAARADRHAARALRALGGARRSCLHVLPRDDAAARALPGAAPRAGAASCSTSRSPHSTTTVRRSSTGSSRCWPASATVLLVDPRSRSRRLAGHGAAWCSR